MMIAFSFCAAARGAAVPSGCAQRSAAGFGGLSVTRTAVRGSPEYCNFLDFFYFWVFPYYFATEKHGKTRKYSVAFNHPNYLMRLSINHRYLGIAEF
ncbi:MAG: hypothetical protein VSS75_033110 [Candidatus Parabeggiatoa sp.]|nr:hypothetical protein [Candidatus Parabeggiatoa sp.]